MDGQGKYGVVGTGAAEVYMRLPRAGYIEKIWDHAAGSLFITEAGGLVNASHMRITWSGYMTVVLR
jgi:3'-phosphoadenosine 5'-phosphosulfate (PAPS) 3'-phosphatase